MIFHILTIFPNLIRPYFKDAILKRALEEGRFTLKVHDLRDYAVDAHRSVDDKPFGGGAGMVMMVGPIYRAVRAIENEAGGRKKEKSRTILLAAKGQPFKQAKAQQLARLDKLILIAGRYEGVDERVAEHIADEELSIGPYVLSGGELPALVVIEAVARLLPGVLGNEASLKEESWSAPETQSGKAPEPGSQTAGLPADLERRLEYPQYTRPAEFKTDEGKVWPVPSLLVSGNHAQVAAWRRKKMKRPRPQ